MNKAESQLNNVLTSIGSAARPLINMDKIVGKLKSRGMYDGYDVYQGSRNGLYVIAGKNKPYRKYISQDEIIMFIRN